MDRAALSRGSLTEAKGIAAAMPDMLIEARRVANPVRAGWHGRRVSGRGETFWQFRPFVAGEAASSIDWRRSARDDHLFVRETEWEAAHTLWLWPDLSPSMNFRSKLASFERKFIEGERSGQSHSVCAASHSVSRTKRWSSRAERRQSIEDAASPATNGRNCQKVSPRPLTLRPCHPASTVLATRRASISISGIAAA